MDGFCKAGKIDKALAIFNDLHSKGLEGNVIAYTILIKGCYQNGLVEKAKELLLKMERDGLSPNGVTYNCIVQGSLKTGKYDDGLAFLEEMAANSFSPDASTVALLLDLLETTEHTPTFFSTPPAKCRKVLEIAVHKAHLRAPHQQNVVVLVFQASLTADRRLPPSPQDDPFNGRIRERLSHSIFQLRRLSNLSVNFSVAFIKQLLVNGD